MRGTVCVKGSGKLLKEESVHNTKGIKRWLRCLELLELKGKEEIVKGGRKGMSKGREKIAKGCEGARIKGCSE